MSGMAELVRGWRARQVVAATLAAIVLLAVAGHFFIDAACLGIKTGAARPCTTSLPSGLSDGQNVSCNWHTGSALVVTPVLITILLLLATQSGVRLHAYLARCAPLFQPPIAFQTA